jgi:hypothetical protein
MVNLLAIAHAAGFTVEQFTAKGVTCIGAVKYDPRRQWQYGIPLDDFEAIVKAAQVEAAPKEPAHV